jgi:ketopantoate reductase
MSSYAIIVTGALGGYYGAKLQRAGLDVHFLVNSDYQHLTSFPPLKRGNSNLRKQRELLT